MNRILLLFLTALLFSSCSTMGDSTPPDSEPEMTAEETELSEGPAIDWYPENITGETRDGKLIGYAKSPGSNADWAFENASYQANANLRIWIDEQVEQARRVLSDELEDVTDREFILQLRIAVNRLDFSNAEIRSDNFEEGETSYVVIRIEESPARVLQDLGDSLSEWPGVWQQMTQVEPLRNWQN